MPLPVLGAPLVAVTLLIVCVLGAFAVGGPALRALDQFGHLGPSVTSGDPRSRLVQFTSSGRVELWRGAADVFRAHPLLGRGANTFQTSWDQVRPDAAEATEAHSLYLESLAELGVPGLLLVVSVLVGVLLAVVQAPGSREARAAGVAILLAWAVHAAVDWDWEMPATAVALFALAGASGSAARVRRGLGRRAGLAGAALLVLVAALPAAWAVSQAHSDDALAAYARGDCRAALDDAASALRLASFRPEALTVRAACLLRGGQAAAAVDAARAAQDADPGDFRGAYDAALVIAATGRDARPAAARAVALDPHAGYANWLRYWLDPTRRRPAPIVVGLAPLLLGGQAYPPVLPPYARRGT
jgi:hypothetical protein